MKTKRISKLVALLLFVGLLCFGSSSVFAFTTESINEHENNDTIQNANVIQTDKIINGTINKVIDKDTFKFTAKNSGKMALRFWTDFEDNSMNIGLMYYVMDVTNGEKHLIGGTQEQNRDECRTDYITFDVIYNHTYVIQVSNWYAPQYVGAKYFLYVTKVISNLESEVNDTIETANYIQFNRMINCKVNSDEDDGDTFAFIATSDWTNYQFYTGNDEISLDAGYYIYIIDDTVGQYDYISGGTDIDRHRSEPTTLSVSFRTIPGHIYNLQVVCQNSSYFDGARYKVKVVNDL